jgi:hypothetical protein
MPQVGGCDFSHNISAKLSVGSCQSPKWDSPNKIEGMLYRCCIGTHDIRNIAPARTAQYHQDAIPPGGERMGGTSRIRLASVFAQRHISHIMIAVFNKQAA